MKLQRHGRNHLCQFQTQLRKLEELGAVTITTTPDDLLIAGLTREGLEHFERRSNIDGIATRPRWS